MRDWNSAERGGKIFEILGCTVILVNKLTMHWILFAASVQVWSLFETPPFNLRESPFRIRVDLALLLYAVHFG